jgi:hypothetical protein
MAQRKRLSMKFHSGTAVVKRLCSGAKFVVLEEKHRSLAVAAQ